MEILLPFRRTVLWMYAKLKEIYLLVATDQIDQIGSSTHVGYVGRSSIPIHVHNKQIQYLYTKLKEVLQGLDYLTNQFIVAQVITF